MVNIFKNRISEQARDEGRWFTFVDGTKWKLASMSSSAFIECLSKLREPHAGLLAAAPDSEEANKIRHETMIKAIAESIVKDWNVEDDKGPMACNPKNVLRILEDKGFDAHTAFVIRSCSDSMSYTISKVDSGN